MGVLLGVTYVCTNLMYAGGVRCKCRCASYNVEIVDQYNLFITIVIALPILNLTDFLLFFFFGF